MRKTSVAVCLPYLLWLAWRKRSILAESAACRRLLKDLQPSDAETDSA